MLVQLLMLGLQVLLLLLLHGLSLLCARVPLLLLLLLLLHLLLLLLERHDRQDLLLLGTEESPDVPVVRISLQGVRMPLYCARFSMGTGSP